MNSDDSNLIQIRCKFCKKLALEISKDVPARLIDIIFLHKMMEGSEKNKSTAHLA